MFSIRVLWLGMVVWFGTQATPTEYLSHRNVCKLDTSRVPAILEINKSYDVGYGDSRMTSHSLRQRLKLINHGLEFIQKAIPPSTQSFIRQHSRVVSLLFQCPDADEIAPCVCSNGAEPTLDCSEVSTFEGIKHILDTAAFPYTDFGKFRYIPTSGNNGDIPSALFGQLTFVDVYFYGTSAEAVADDVFAGSEQTLSSVYFDYNVQLSSISFLWVENYANLLSLIISNSAIKEISKFGAAPMLTQVLLPYNQATTVVEGAFENLPFVQYLDLGANQLAEITTEELTISSEFLAIYLDSNKLEEMDPFGGAVPVLLYLDRNLLTTFEEEVYGPILDRIASCSYTSYVSVEYNPINCTEMSWMGNHPNYDSHVISNC